MVFWRKNAISLHAVNRRARLRTAFDFPSRQNLQLMCTQTIINTECVFMRLLCHSYVIHFVSRLQNAGSTQRSLRKSPNQKNNHQKSSHRQRHWRCIIPTTHTYGLRNIIRKVASGARCSSAGSDSRTCSLAAFTSSDCGWTPVPSSSTLKRYRKHLSLKGCSWFTASIA